MKSVYYLRYTLMNLSEIFRNIKQIGFTSTLNLFSILFQYYELSIIWHSLLPSEESNVVVWGSRGQVELQVFSRRISICCRKSFTRSCRFLLYRALAIYQHIIIPCRTVMDHHEMVAPIFSFNTDRVENYSIEIHPKCINQINRSLLD